MAEEADKEMTIEELERHVVGFIVVAIKHADGGKFIQLLPLQYFGLTDDGVQNNIDLASDNEIVGVIPWTHDLPKYTSKKVEKS